MDIRRRRRIAKQGIGETAGLMSQAGFAKSPAVELLRGVRSFFKGPLIKTELMVVWLEKHGIAATMEMEGDAVGAQDEEDLGREAVVLVPEADYDRAYRLFYADREDEL